MLDLEDWGKIKPRSAGRKPISKIFMPQDHYGTELMAPGTFGQGMLVSLEVYKKHLDTLSLTSV